MTAILRAAWAIGLFATVVVVALLVPPELVDGVEEWRMRRAR